MVPRVELTAERVEVGGRVAVQSEVRDEHSRRLPRPHPFDAGLPRAHVDVGWRRRRQHVRTRPDADAARVARVHHARTPIAVTHMVRGVARGIRHVEQGAADIQHVFVGRHHEIGGWHRRELPPQTVHLIPVEPRRAREQLRGVHQVRRASLMHVHLHVRMLADDRPRRSGVIEMDVRQQQPVHVTRCATDGGQPVKERRQAAGRSGIDDQHASGRVNRARRDAAGAAEKLQVDRCQGHGDDSFMQVNSTPARRPARSTGRRARGGGIVTEPPRGP